MPNKNKNSVEYKWKKIFASKRYHAKDGNITLTPEEQQEILDEISQLRSDSVTSQIGVYQEIIEMLHAENKKPIHYFRRKSSFGNKKDYNKAYSKWRRRNAQINSIESRLPDLKALLQSILDNQQEVIGMALRFNGVHIAHIEQAFKDIGIEIEPKF